MKPPSMVSTIFLASVVEGESHVAAQTKWQDQYESKIA